MINMIYTHSDYYSNNGLITPSIQWINHTPCFLIWIRYCGCFIRFGYGLACWSLAGWVCQHYISYHTPHSMITFTPLLLFSTINNLSFTTLLPFLVLNQAFAFYTFSNLAPRAVKHHQWFVLCSFVCLFVYLFTYLSPTLPWKSSLT